MSDVSRKPLSNQISEKLTPQSEKSTPQKISETVTGLADKVAAKITPNHEKSTTQQVVDKTRK